MNKHEKEDETPRGVSVGKAPSAEADPVIEASDKAIADLDIKQPDVKDTTARVQEPIVEKSEKDKDA